MTKYTLTRRYNNSPQTVYDKMDVLMNSSYAATDSRPIRAKLSYNFLSILDRVTGCRKITSYVTGRRL